VNRYLHAGLVVGAVAAVVCLYGDYGVTWDAPNQHQYGQHVVRYYETFFTDLAALTYLDAYLYGGVFDTVAALLVRVSPLGIFETRHLLNALVGLAGILAVWKMARLAGGEGSAWMATALLLLEPSYFGHMFNNPKDIPFAVGYAWSVYYLMCSFGHLPKIPCRLQLKLGLAIGLTLGVRIGGLVLVGYLGLAVALFLAFPRLLAPGPGAVASGTRRLRDLARSLLVIAVVAYALMLLFWPWAQQSPLLRPFEALSYMSHFKVNDEGLLNQVLIGGEYVKAKDLPATYMPHYLVVKLPETLLAGLVVAAIMVYLARGRVHTNPLQAARVSLLVLSVIFPLCYVVAVKSVLYDTMRHFLFILPPLCVVSGLGWSAAIERIGRPWSRRRQLFAAAVCLLLAPQGYRMVKLHPHQYVHYNQLVGGVEGAQGRYEMDYWGNSYKEAVERLGEYVAERDGAAAQVRKYAVWAVGPERSATYYFPGNFVPVSSGESPDFIISFTRWGVDRRIPGRPVAYVERQGATLAVIKEQTSPRRE
jgi:hypothetical protein